MSASETVVLPHAPTLCPKSPLNLFVIITCVVVVAVRTHTICAFLRVSRASPTGRHPLAYLLVFVELKSLLGGAPICLMYGGMGTLERQHLFVYCSMSSFSQFQHPWNGLKIS